METKTNRDPAVAQQVMGGSSGPIIRVRRDSGFYDNIPWDKVEYWVDEGFFPLPVANVGPHTLYDFAVPQGLVLDVTSVVFRIMHRVAVGPPVQSAFLHDAALRHIGWFTLKVGGTSFYRNNEIRPWLNTQGDTFSKLNQDIMVPQLPFHTVVRPGQHIVVQLQFEGAPVEIGFYTGYAFVELRGLFMAKGLFDKLAKEFGS